jgi:type I restriction enzyme, S subunit
MPEWERVKLGEVMTHRKKFITIDDLAHYERCRVQVRAQGIVLRDKVTGADIKTKKQQVCRAGEFLVAEIDAKVGGFGLVPEELDGAVVSSHYFLFEIGAQGSTNYAAIRPTHVLSYTIPLPPLPEQRRIVARVKGMLEKVEEMQRLRKGTSGEVQILLDRFIDTFMQNHKDPTIPLGELLREGSFNGLAAKPSGDTSGTQILRISAATARRDALVNESDYKYLSLTNYEKQKYALQPGDLLACRFNGNLKYVGRFALYEGNSSELQVYPDKLIRFRVNTSHILPEFVRLAMNSSGLRELVESFCTTTAGNIGIGAGNLKLIPLPVPSLDTQRQLVHAAANIQAWATAIGSIQAETQTELNALPSAILARAFAGAL